MAKTTKKKYSRAEYIKDDTALKANIEAYAVKVNARRNKLGTKFIKDNSPVEVDKVYIPVEGMIKRKGCNRFVVTQLQVQFMGFTKERAPMIKAGGYWIDKITDTAKQWDGSLVVYGVGNPAIFKLAENQNYTKHPDGQ